MFGHIFATKASPLTEIIALVLWGLFGLSAPATAQVRIAVEYYLLGWWDYGDAGYFVTSSSEEITALDMGVAAGALQHTGEAFNVWIEPTSGALPTCRFWSPKFLSHFFTPYAAECEGIQSDPNWQYEGIAFYLKVPDENGSCPIGTTILFRLYNNGIGDASHHRLTTSEKAFNQMHAWGWVFEGDARTRAFACVPLSAAPSTPSQQDFS